MYYYFIKYTAGNGARSGNFKAKLENPIRYFSDIDEVIQMLSNKTLYSKDQIIIDMIYPVAGEERP